MKNYSFFSESVLLIENGIRIPDSKGNQIGIIEIRFREGIGKKHYHITSPKLGGKICVLMDKCEYYIHDEWINKFRNKKAKQFLNTFLDSQFFPGKTYWQYFKELWNSAHRYDRIKRAIIPMDLQHPDYTKLPC